MLHVVTRCFGSLFDPKFLSPQIHSFGTKSVPKHLNMVVDFYTFSGQYAMPVFATLMRQIAILRFSKGERHAELPLTITLPFYVLEIDLSRYLIMLLILRVPSGWRSGTPHDSEMILAQYGEMAQSVALLKCGEKNSR